MQHFDGYWVVEMKIPFKTIRYKPEIKKWGINFSRNNLKINENSSSMKNLLEIRNILGIITQPIFNTPLFYIYDD